MMFEGIISLVYVPHLFVLLTRKGRKNQQGVPVVHDPDQDSTDLMKCVSALRARENALLIAVCMKLSTLEGGDFTLCTANRNCHSRWTLRSSRPDDPYPFLLAQAAQDAVARLCGYRR